LLILAVAYLVWRGAYVLLEAFAGVLVAVLLSVLSNWVSKHTRLSYGHSLALVVLGLFFIGGGLGILMWSHLSAQASELTQSLPRSLDQIKAYLMQYAWGKYLVQKVPGATIGLAEMGQFTRLTGFGSGVANFLEATIVILIVGIFGAAEPDLYWSGLLHLVPPRNRERVGEALDAIAFNLRHWLVGVVILMVLIGITTWAGLWLIGVPMALTLGIIAGVLEVVPYVGAWLSAVPALLIALLKGPQYLLYTLVLYLFIHIFEGYILEPLIQSRAVHLPPALILVAQALMGEMFGVLGLFVAAPLTVVAMVLLKMLYVKDTLGDEEVDVPGEPSNDGKKAAQPA
jgi:predicted PurR-regulated permease PerM